MYVKKCKIQLQRNDLYIHKKAATTDTGGAKNVENLYDGNAYKTHF